MPTTFIGYNTQGQFKKFTLINQELIRRDFLNSFNIQQGELPGRPEFGTVLWSYIFEPLTVETTQGVIREIQRMAGYDARISITDIQIFSQLNGILIEIEVAYVEGVDSEVLSLFFDQITRRASYI